MQKQLLSIIGIFVFLLSACTAPTPRPDASDNPPAESTSDPTMPDISISLPPEKIEVEVTEDQVLKFYDYFANIAPGFAQIPFAMGGDFAEFSFGSVTEISDAGLTIYALENLSQNGLLERDEGGYSCWKTDAVIREIERAFAREVIDFGASGLVNEIPEDGILKSTGWSAGEGFSAKLIQLSQWQDGTATGVFEFYGVSDYLLEVGPFDIKDEIVKDYSEILNSKYCVKTTKAISFIENHDENGFYLQFLSMESW